MLGLPELEAERSSVVLAHEIFPTSRPSGPRFHSQVALSQTLVAADQICLGDGGIVRPQRATGPVATMSLGGVTEESTPFSVPA